MRTMGILTRLRASGLTLQPSGDRLVVDSNKPLTDQQRQFIRQHKAAILRVLESPSAEANRQSMPHVASVVDAFRSVFGSEVRVTFAEEGGRRIGRQEAEQKAAVCQHCRHWQGTRSGSGYCCIGFAPPIARQATESCEQFIREACP